MTRDSQITIVPQKIVANGDPNEVIFEVVDKNGLPVIRVMGDGKLGLNNNTPGGEGAALTAPAVAAASFTFTAPGADDFAIQALVQNTGFGFVTANEGHSTLKAFQNALVRIAEIEARLQAAGIIA